VSTSDGRVDALLRRRVSDALAAHGSLDGADDALRQEMARNPALAAYARDVAAIDDALRRWPSVMRSEAAWEGLAQRIEQRLGEAPSEGLDVTAPPSFDDEDARRDVEGGTGGGVAAAIAAKRVRFDLANLKHLDATQELVVEDILEEIEAERRQSSAASALVPRAAREERASLPRIAGPPPTLKPLAPVALAPVREPSRRAPLLVVVGTLSAAAVAVIGVSAAMLRAGRDEHAPAAAVAAGGALVPAAPALQGLEAAGGPLRVADPAAAEVVAMPAPLAAEGRGDVVGGAAVGGAAPGAPAATGALDRGAAASAPAADEADFDPASDLRSASAGGGGRGAGVATTGARSLVARGRARPGAAASSAAAAAGAPLPDTPSRADVLAAMQAVRSAVSSCAAGSRGVATVRVTFAGNSGRVTSAVVEGAYAGTVQGSCIARAVRGAQLPPFAQATFSVTFPFALGE
jgi:hypothetical protein